MTTEPADAAVSTPVLATIVARDVLLQLQVPPLTPSLKVTWEPVQILVGPDMAEGTGFTITDVVEIQPAPRL
jgi:hypothetical protein